MKIKSCDVHFIGMMIITIAVVGVVFLLTIPLLIESITIASLDESCFKFEKKLYCESMGMELGSIVVTPGGLFGGSPYNKDACVSENSEKIIELKDLDLELCR